MLTSKTPFEKAIELKLIPNTIQCFLMEIDKCKIDVCDHSAYGIICISVDISDIDTIFHNEKNFETLLNVLPDFEFLNRLLIEKKSQYLFTVNDHEVTNANPFSFALDDMTFVNIYNDSNSNSPWKVVIELESEREKINSFDDKV